MLINTYNVDVTLGCLHNTRHKARGDAFGRNRSTFLPSRSVVNALDLLTTACANPTLLLEHNFSVHEEAGSQRIEQYIWVSA